MVDISRRYRLQVTKLAMKIQLLFLNYAIVATPESGGYAYLVIPAPKLFVKTVYWISYTGLPSPYVSSRLNKHISHAIILQPFAFIATSNPEF